MTTRQLQRALGWVVLVLLAWSLYESGSLRAVSAPLAQRPASPHGVLDLQLPLNEPSARAVVAEWSCQPMRAGCTDVRPVACESLRRDYRLIAAYTTTAILTAIWAAWVAGVSGWIVLLLSATVVGAAACDGIENWLVAQQLGVPCQLPVSGLAGWLPSGAAVYAAGHAVALARAAAMTKFVLLLPGLLGTLVLVGAAWRERASQRRASDAPVDDQAAEAAVKRGDFSAVLQLETDGIFANTKDRTRDEPRTFVNAAADEPWVEFRAADVIGLALSGGGIRSATFNLGVLQGLHRLDLLRLFDYVTSVSGGGYVASLWSEWMARRRDDRLRDCSELASEQRDLAVPPSDLFPAPPDGQLSRFDSDAERHVREFSGFLAPRWGFFEVETWTALVAVIAGLVPALAIALSVIGTILVLWLMLTFPLASPTPAAPLPVIGALTVAALAWFEHWWHTIKGSDTRTMPSAGQAHATGDGGLTAYFVFALGALVLALLLQAWLPHAYLAWAHTPLPILTSGWHGAPGLGGFERWWYVAGIAQQGRSWVFSPRLFDYGLSWLGAALLLTLVRLLYPLAPGAWTRHRLAAFDRVLMRMLGLGVAWCGLAVVWHLAINLGQPVRAAVAALVSGGAFAALRTWIGVVLRRPTQPGMLDRLRPYLPQVLAYVTILLAAGALGQLLIRLCDVSWIEWWAVTFVMGLVLVLGLFLDPGAFGLHAFYRERISRAYAGAANLAEGQHAAQNRTTEPRDGDDRPLAALVSRPLHLVCCAANDLTGDPVGTLSRGGRSGVLSRYGFVLGPHWAAEPDLPLGAAITASAAAFNSNMGSVSLQVGPAVAFLMTALNLRLGLWLRHPRAQRARPRRWPGLLLYREMFGSTSASGLAAGMVDVPALMRDIHLSDGGHFENLALYELVRRHCRYVIVSDCTADPDVAFDDLGNALRRIREDFGVDITLDVDPLRPVAGGWSRQHVAVGTIRYSATDRGILLYVKPTMTGDEPPDVLQYKARNAAFPHEGTQDQFYDEAQWESYRRLGLHAAECIFEFVVAPSRERLAGIVAANGPAAAPLTADWVFAEASHAWGGTPPGLVDRVLEMTQRVSDLQTEFRQGPAPRVLDEFFPELAEIAPPPKAGTGNGESKAPEPMSATDLWFVMRITQLMEDVWMACDLDRLWSHPLNLGWVNLFARFATAPSFRTCWPLFAAMYSPGFRRFVDHRFPITRGSKSVDRREGRVELLKKPEESPGLAARWWMDRSGQPCNWRADKTYYQKLVDLPGHGGPLSVQVAIVGVTTVGTLVGWNSDDYFVPPSLWGAGLGESFLNGVLEKLAKDCSRCFVVVKSPPALQRHQVALDDRRAFIEQYRKLGFRQRLRTSTELSPADFEFARTLGFAEDDTLFELELAQWARAHRGRP